MSAVEKFCQSVWSARDAGNLTDDVRMLSQQLHVAVAADVACNEGYDPGADRKVEWALEVIRRRRSGVCARLCLASPALEASADFLLWNGLRKQCGKDLAAGAA